MKRRIGCLHAHYSNIGHIQSAIASTKWDLTHFVDPGLMSRIALNDRFDETEARNKVLEQMDWISQSNVDEILITCTNYINLLEDGRVQTPVPIIKMDEPLFRYLCSLSGPQVLLFTNPTTVEGTVKRLHAFAEREGKTLGPVEVLTIENTFELIIQGNKEQYISEVSSFMRSYLSANPDKHVSVVQLSMVAIAEKFENELGMHIGNPLRTLAAYFDNR